MSDPLAASLDKLIAQRDAAGAAEARIRDEEEQKKVAQDFTRLSALRADENVRWFLDTELGPIVAEECKKALVPATAAIQGPVAANRYEIGQQLLDLLEKRHAEAQAAVDAILSGKR